MLINHKQSCHLYTSCEPQNICTYMCRKCGPKKYFGIYSFHSIMLFLPTLFYIYSDTCNSHVALNSRDSLMFAVHIAMFFGAWSVGAYSILHIAGITHLSVTQRASNIAENCVFYYILYICVCRSSPPQRPHDNDAETPPI